MVISLAFIEGYRFMKHVLVLLAFIMLNILYTIPVVVGGDGGRSAAADDGKKIAIITKYIWLL